MVMEAAALNPAEFTKLVAADARKWEKVVKAVGIRLD